MTAPCICTQFVSHVAVRRRVWTKAALFDRMEKSIVRNYDSKHDWLNRQEGWLCRRGVGGGVLGYQLHTKVTIYWCHRLWWAETAGTTSSCTFVWNRLCRECGCRYVAEGQAGWLYNDWCGSQDEGPQLWGTRIRQCQNPPLPRIWMNGIYKLTSLKILFVTGPLLTIANDVTQPTRSEMMHPVCQSAVLVYTSKQLLYKNFYKSCKRSWIQFLNVDLKEFSKWKWKTEVNSTDIRT